MPPLSFQACSLDGIILQRHRRLWHHYHLARSLHSPQCDPRQFYGVLGLGDGGYKMGRAPTPIGTTLRIGYVYGHPPPKTPNRKVGEEDARAQHGPLYGYISPPQSIVTSVVVTISAKSQHSHYNRFVLYYTIQLKSKK